MIKLSMRRPVAVAMGYVAVALLGVRAWQDIPIELMPDTQLPRLTVNGTWRGASPETVEAFLTSPLEAAIQLVEGVEKVVSESSEGSATIRIEFSRDVDMDFARLDLSERLATLEENELPPGVDRVVVQPYIPDEFRETQNRGLLRYTFTGARTLESLRKHLDDVVIPELSRVEGVALVTAYGGRERLLEVELDRELMAAMGVSTWEVDRKLADLDLVREAGAVRDGDRQWTVTIRNRPVSAQDIRNAIVKSDGGRIVRVSDIAVVRDTYEDIRSHNRVNSRPAVDMLVTKEIGANSVRVADRVKERLAAVELRNPPNTRFILDWDESRQIRRQMSDLRSRALISVIVIFGVLFLFLGSLRSAVVVFATIASSILISLNLIYFAGFSLNVLTLMGLAMAFGLIVDNSIVVLENIYRRWQSGRPRDSAILEGASHVVLPIMAATATTLIVFAPFVYLQDELRIYYLPLAIVVVLSLLASLLVAFSFIPGLVGRILPARDDAGTSATGTSATGKSAARDPFYLRFYRGLVGYTLRWPWVVVGVCVALLGGSGYLFDQYVNKGRVWGGGWGQQTYIDISIRLPRGSDIERTDQLTRYFEERLREMPEVERFVTQVYPERSQTRVTFPEELELTDVPVRIKEQLFAFSLGFSRAEVRVYGYGPSFYGGGGSPPNYSIQVLGYNYEKVRDIAEDLGGRLQRYPRIRDVNTNASFGYFMRDRASEFAVDVRRDVVARHDMTVDVLVGQISDAVRGQVSQDLLKIGGDEVRYDVKLEGNREVDLVELRQTMVLTPAGNPVRLGELVTIRPREVLATIRREDQQYERTVAYEFRGPYKLGDLYHNTVIDMTSVPPGYTVKKADRWRWSTEEQSQMALVLLVSIFLIYMVTAALFESLLLPLCVLLTVPMALIGVFLLFFYLDAHFTREAYIGVIMMGGIVVNNAILLVDHINRVRRETALALKPAILKGTLERVRPILMTTTTTILGLTPLVIFSETANSNIWNALTYALIGGLASSTFLVLTATPALYLLFERGKERRADWAVAEASVAATGAGAG
jgi:HAE1 family hydrophobic/amphiphilic exporter-1